MSYRRRWLDERSLDKSLRFAVTVLAASVIGLSCSFANDFRLYSSLDGCNTLKYWLTALPHCGSSKVKQGRGTIFATSFREGVEWGLEEPLVEGKREDAPLKKSGVVRSEV